MTVTPDGTPRFSRRRAHSPPNASSCSQALPTPATRICFSNCRSSGVMGADPLHLGGLEVQVPADVAHDVLAGVVVHGHADVDLLVVVDEDPLDRRAVALEQVVLRVAVRVWAQDDVAAAREAPAVDDDRLLAPDVGV